MVVNDRSSEARLLVVDDEPSIRELLTASLRFAGFEVFPAADGAEALKLAEQHRPDLVVLDIMLPDLDGFTVTRKLRERGRDVPVVFLTARDDTSDKVTGLTVGGDDYVTKPFSLEELVARIRSILRRTGQAAEDSGRLAFEDLELDEDTREVTRGGHLIELTATEYRLLLALAGDPHRVFTREELLRSVWRLDTFGRTRTLDTHAFRLRHKLCCGSDEKLVVNVWGVGYRLMDAVITS